MCALVEPGAQIERHALEALQIELSGYCFQHLASFKRPRHLLLAHVPRTDAGKVGRAAVRLALLEGRISPVFGVPPTATTAP